MRVTEDRMVIKSEQGDYPVDFVAELGLVPALVDAGPETFVIIDELLADIYGDALSALLEHPTYRVKADEESKTLSGVSLFVDWLLENKATRSAHVVAIGGGVVQDVATFRVPHLLPRDPVDIRSDHSAQPSGQLHRGQIQHQRASTEESARRVPLTRHVVICSEFLKSLPQIEVDSGYGEIFTRSHSPTTARSSMSSPRP